MKTNGKSNATNIVARINEVEIQVVANGEETLVPIKPICQALGVDFDSQKQKLNAHEIFSSVKVLSTSTGSDGKTYQMLCLPYKYIFGWLFTINPKNVKEEAKESVIKYQNECNDALFRYFTEPTTFLQQKQSMIDKYLDEYETAKNNFKHAKDIMADKKKAFDEVRNFSIEEWRANSRQYVIPFTD